MEDPTQFVMSDAVDDDVQALFAGVYKFITTHGYANANVAGFVNADVLTLTVNAQMPNNEGGYSYSQNRPMPPAPAPASAKHPTEVA